MKEHTYNLKLNGPAIPVPEPTIIKTTNEAIPSLLKTNL